MNSRLHNVLSSLCNTTFPSAALVMRLATVSTYPFIGHSLMIVTESDFCDKDNDVW